MYEEFKIPAITPEYLEECRQKAYKDDRENPNNFSNWNPHIKSYGYFKKCKLVSNQIFTIEEVHKMQKTDCIDDVDWNIINEVLKPTLQKMEPYKKYFIKNGCFSNKYDFSTCIATKETLAENLWKINYESAMYDTGGNTELVVRELIPYNEEKIPTIYNGMPLREEVRCFYDMDSKKLLYIEDYWNYDYCNDKIRNKTDNIIFNWFHNKVRTRHEQHIQILNQLKRKIEDNIDSLEFDDELHRSMEHRFYVCNRTWYRRIIFNRYGSRNTKCLL